MYSAITDLCFEPSYIDILSIVPAVHTISNLLLKVPFANNCDACLILHHVAK